MEMVGALIGVVIAMVVGVALLPVIVNTIATLNTETTDASVISLAGLLPIILIAIVIMGAVAFVAGGLG
ncbi:hypothetical protein LCGC14_0347870 [marine sediment metagenome]|uniref:Uncharacterized protein n=1 Tax=marine sediment metagenome TaxID=412755 RepID=A0A0F9TBR0_9ZZZZ